MNSTSPLNTHSGTPGVSASADAPSVTTTMANTRLVGFYTARQQSISSLPGSMTARWNTSAGGGANSVGFAAGDEAFAGPGATGTRSATLPSSFDWIAQLVALQPNANRNATFSWTATTSTFATGYKLERWSGSTLQTTQTITPRTTVTASDSNIADAVTFTYRLYSYRTNWTSTQATATLSALTC